MPTELKITVKIEVDSLRDGMELVEYILTRATNLDINAVVKTRLRKKPEDLPF